jgi:uncharacterized membrane protein
VTIDNDYIMLKKGDRAFLGTLYTGSQQTYTLNEPDRLPVLAGLVGLFIILVVLLGGLQGIRGLITLTGSLLLIGYLLLPGILHNYPILLLTIGVAALIIIIGSYVTHGFTKTTTAAVIGMIVTVIVTGLLALIVVHMAKLNGFYTEEAVDLTQINSKINLVSLLLGGIIIGLLGVLYDAAIGQAVAVEELHHIASHLPRKVIFTRAIRIGREHIGALVNTLAIAYVGVSLPLLLLFTGTDGQSLGQIVNQQIFATEIVRTMVGSIGLVLAVPITTFLAIAILMPKEKKNVSQEVLEKEHHALEHFQHHH